MQLKRIVGNNFSICNIHNAHRGFALLEVLVAVLIFSIGLLGLAGLQLTSLKFTHGAYQLTQFTETTYDMTDRMRANLPGVIAGQYGGVIGESELVIGHDKMPANPSNKCVGIGKRCDAGQLAQAELFQWATQLSNIFKHGWKATISCVDVDDTDADICTRGSVHTIKIEWQELVDAQTAANGTEKRKFSTSFQAGRQL